MLQTRELIEALAQSLGFDVKEQLQDPLISSIGNAGAASIFLMLAATLEGSNLGIGF